MGTRSVRSVPALPRGPEIQTGRHHHQTRDDAPRATVVLVRERQLPGLTRAGVQNGENAERDADQADEGEQGEQMTHESLGRDGKADVTARLDRSAAGPRGQEDATG